MYTKSHKIDKGWGVLQKSLCFNYLHVSRSFKGGGGVNFDYLYVSHVHDPRISLGALERPLHIGSSGTKVLVHEHLIRGDTCICTTREKN